MPSQGLSSVPCSAAVLLPPTLHTNLNRVFRGRDLPEEVHFKCPAIFSSPEDNPRSLGRSVVDSHGTNIRSSQTQNNLRRFPRSFHIIIWTCVGAHRSVGRDPRALCQRRGVVAEPVDAHPPAHTTLLRVRAHKRGSVPDPAIGRSVAREEPRGAGAPAT